MLNLIFMELNAVSQSVSQILLGLLLSVSAVEHWKSSKFTLAFDSFLEV